MTCTEMTLDIKHSCKQKVENSFSFFVFVLFVLMFVFFFSV